MPLSPELLASYKNADYVVFGHQRGSPELVIRVDRVNPALDELLTHNEAASAAFVTACNPRGEKKTYEENEAAAAALRASPALIGYAWFKGEGRDPEGRWPAEPSLLIVGIAHMFFHRIEELPGRRPLEAGPGPVGAARSPGGAAS